VESIPEERLWRTLDNLCPGGVAQISGYRGVGLASPLYQVCDVDLLKRVLAQAEAWDGAAETGFKKVAGVLSDDRQLADLLARYADNPDDVLRRTFTLIGDSGAAWTGNAVDGLFRAGDEFGIAVAETIAQNPAYADDVVARTFEIFDSSVGWQPNRFSRLPEVLERHGASSVVVQRIENLKSVDGIDKLVFDLGTPTEDSTIALGALFQLEYADFIGSGRISKVSDIIEGKDAADILLDDPSVVVDTKRYVWSSYNPYILEQELRGEKGLLKQVERFKQLYPGNKIEYVFDSRHGTVPELIRNGLQEVGVIVKEFP
jgi:hypothetical protein